MRDVKSACTDRRQCLLKLVRESGSCVEDLIARAQREAWNPFMYEWRDGCSVGEYVESLYKPPAECGHCSHARMDADMSAKMAFGIGFILGLSSDKRRLWRGDTHKD